MQISVVLHSVLREKFHPDAKGRMVMDFPDHSTILDVMKVLELPSQIRVAVNDEITSDYALALCDGDELRFLRQSSGG